MCAHILINIECFANTMVTVPLEKMKLLVHRFDQSVFAMQATRDEMPFQSSARVCVCVCVCVVGTSLSS